MGPERNQNNGSLIISEPIFLVIGKIMRPHGIHGELLMQIHTDFPERIIENYRVYVGEDHLPLVIRSRRIDKKGLLVSFESLNNPEAVKHLSNMWVYVRSDEIPSLPEGDYYQHELIGLRVENEGGLLFGVISQVLETGGNDVFVVTSLTGSEFLIPFAPGIVDSIDLAKRVVVVQLIEGLLPD
jgi:16S rRNA processing protein RimM